VSPLGRRRGILSGSFGWFAGCLEMSDPRRNSAHNLGILLSDLSVAETKHRESEGLEVFGPQTLISKFMRGVVDFDDQPRVERTKVGNPVTARDLAPEPSSSCLVLQAAPDPRLGHSEVPTQSLGAIAGSWRVQRSCHPATMTAEWDRKPPSPATPVLPPSGGEMGAPSYGGSNPPFPGYASTPPFGGETQTLKRNSTTSSGRIT
jgi:hypothetical protein